MTNRGGVGVVEGAEARGSEELRRWTGSKAEHRPPGVDAAGCHCRGRVEDRLAAGALTRARGPLHERAGGQELRRSGAASAGPEPGQRRSEGSRLRPRQERTRLRRAKWPRVMASIHIGPPHRARTISSTPRPWRSSSSTRSPRRSRCSTLSARARAGSSGTRALPDGWMGAGYAQLILLERQDRLAAGAGQAEGERPEWASCAVK